MTKTEHDNSSQLAGLSCQVNFLNLRHDIWPHEHSLRDLQEEPRQNRDEEEAQVLLGRRISRDCGCAKQTRENDKETGEKCSQRRR